MFLGNLSKSGLFLSLANNNLTRLEWKFFKKFFPAITFNLEGSTIALILLFGLTIEHFFKNMRFVFLLKIRSTV